MIDEIEATLSGYFFPTDQYKHNFDDAKFLEFRKRQLLVSEKVKKILPNKKYDIVTRFGVNPNIAWSPWIGIQSLDENFDSSSKRGIYITLLWKVDGSGICLSLQTGTDESNQREIKEIVLHIRNRLGSDFGFSHEINLNNYPKAKRPKNYELANIIGREYTADDLNSLGKDLLQMEQIYQSIIYKNERRVKAESITDSEETNYQKPPKYRKSSSSKQVARDPKIKDEAIEAANHLCEVNPSHTTFNIDGVQFMEGHHLIPFEEQGKFEKVSLDFQENIISLCPNCHSEIHYADASRRIELALSFFEVRKDKLSKFINIDAEQICAMYAD